MPRPKRTTTTPPESAQPLPPLPDRRSLEQTMVNVQRLLAGQDFGSIEEANAFLQEALASGKLQVETRPPSTPLEKAQNVMYEAFSAQSPAQRVKLARKALTISPDCADAYVLLAEESAGSPWEAMTLYQQGMAAGERALGPEAFQELVGDFWGVLETRPYMRARLGLAELLIALGRRKEAITHLEQLLVLNPNDNQGVRDVLASVLLDIGDDAALLELQDRYPEESASWLYNRALMLYRQQGGDSGAAKEALRKAIEQNPFVVIHLLGDKDAPTEMPQYVQHGGESEASEYVLANTVAWLRTVGALEWLFNVVSSRLPRTRKSAGKGKKK